jgi:5-formyltetrahydrofolate cyclo-ligase
MKKTFRKEMIGKRNTLSEQAVHDKSFLITETILKSDLLKNNKTIMLYMDFRNEVRTIPLIQELLKDHTLVLPKVDMTSHTMSLHLIKNLDDLVLSDYGILEPSNQATVEAKDLDLILAPGVAFDRNGYRLGYGGGFYDRLLESKNKCTMVVALAFDCQITDEVPREAHDFQMDAIVTESEVMIFNDQLQGVI